MDEKKPGEKVRRSEVSALCWLLCAAVECAIEWGWTEEGLVKLVRACFMIVGEERIA